MTALIKTLIATIIGMFGSLEIEQGTAAKVPCYQEQRTFISGDFYRQTECYERSEISWEWLKESSDS